MYFLVLTFYIHMHIVTANDEISIWSAITATAMVILLLYTLMA
jgi:hypothetical protein